ncbi:MAG: hypothetical protein HQ557_06435 [Bacteroidetes bacterium]|nr:hypothetical protein [Bacteroidota bacterium]
MASFGSIKASLPSAPCLNIAAVAIRTTKSLLNLNDFSLNNNIYISEGRRSIQNIFPFEDNIIIVENNLMEVKPEGGVYDGKLRPKITCVNSDDFTITDEIYLYERDTNQTIWASFKEDENNIILVTSKYLDKKGNRTFIRYNIKNKSIEQINTDALDDVIWSWNGHYVFDDKVAFVKYNDADIDIIVLKLKTY